MSGSDLIERWLAEYRQAWSTDNEATIAALFTSDARYFTAPYRPPLVGSDEIARWWMEQGESRMRWEFTGEEIASDDSLYVVRGRTTYRDTPGPTGRPEVYHNLWLITLADDGRAREFVEYWMLEQ